MYGRAHVVIALAFAVAWVAGCGLTLDLDPPDPRDGMDAGAHDAGSSGIDAGTSDAGASDGGTNTGTDSGWLDPCVGSPDGTVCDTSSSPPLVCVAGRCRVSVCGDGVVDPRAGEQCDDGNAVSGDGCEPIGCVPTCVTADDCDDGIWCNGIEDCGADSTCVRGTPPFSPLCTTAIGGEGMCDGDFCVPDGCGNGVVDPGEECDDGNTTPGDGCNPDCTWTCTSDEECDDGDVCNGREVCTVGGCALALGTPLTCRAPDECHAAMCDPRVGCLTVLIDADHDGQASAELASCGLDCDDADPTRYAGAPELCNGVDDDCDGIVDEDISDVRCYTDADGDGFGDPESWTEACLCPAGTVTIAGDCFDAPSPVGAAVHPRQATFHRQPYCRSGSTGSCSFDYDCDGREEPQSEALYTGCTLLGRCAGSGWEGNVPACGGVGTWIECDSLLGVGLICIPRRSARVQHCR